MKDREAISLEALRRYMVEGEDVEKISEALDLPPANVRHLLFKPHRIKVTGNRREKSARRVRELGYNSLAEYLAGNWTRPIQALSTALGISREKVSHYYGLLTLLADTSRKESE